MSKTINILNSRISNNDDKSTLTFDLKIGDNNHSLYFSVDKKYGEYLCGEIADGVLTILLPFAVKNNYDIVSAIPVSEEILYNFNWHFLPQVAVCNKIDIPQIKIETVKTDYKPFAVSTGISCGVDSFTTLKEYTVECKYDDYKLTHLAFFENGAHHLGINGFSEEQKKCYEEQKEFVLKFCEQYNYEVVIVESNINEVLSKAFENDAFEHTHTFRNIGIVLQMQKLFKIYYYSSAWNLDVFNVDITRSPARYEKYLFSILTTKNTRIYSSNKAMTRLEKTEYILDFEQSYDNLLVCYMGGHNCGKCGKCIRTMITLDMLGKLELYKNSFDVEYYKKNKPIILSRIYAKKHFDPFMKELHKYAKSTGYKIPLFSKVLGMVLFVGLAIKRALHI